MQTIRFIGTLEVTSRGFPESRRAEAHLLAPRQERVQLASARTVAQ